MPYLRNQFVYQLIASQTFLVAFTNLLTSISVFIGYSFSRCWVCEGVLIVALFRAISKFLSSYFLDPFYVFIFDKNSLLLFTIYLFLLPLIICLLYPSQYFPPLLRFCSLYLCLPSFFCNSLWRCSLNRPFTHVAVCFIFIFKLPFPPLVNSYQVFPNFFRKPAETSFFYIRQLFYIY